MAGSPDDPAPRVRLAGEAGAAARSRGVTVQVSLTHAREMAGAVAIAETADGPGGQGPEGGS